MFSLFVVRCRILVAAAAFFLFHFVLGSAVCVTCSKMTCRYLCFCIKCKIIYVHYLFRKHCRFDARLQLLHALSLSPSLPRFLVVSLLSLLSRTFSVETFAARSLFPAPAIFLGLHFSCTRNTHTPMHAHAFVSLFFLSLLGCHFECT